MLRGSSFNKDFPRARPRLFLVRMNEGCVLCEDINIAAELLCHGTEAYWDNREGKFQIIQHFESGVFQGAVLLKFKNRRTGREGKAITFKISGNPEELNYRRKLFHASRHLSDGNTRRYHRERLLDALREAQKADEEKSYVPIIKGGGIDAVSEGENSEGLRRTGSGVQERSNGGREPGGEVGSEKEANEASGDRSDDGEEAGGSEEVETGETIK